MTDDKAIPKEVIDLLWSPEGNCMNCGRPVTEFAGRLVHVGPDGYKSNVGCRAASFDWRHERDEKHPWDDSLKRSLNAKLPRRT